MICIRRGGRCGLDGRQKLAGQRQNHRVDIHVRAARQVRLPWGRRGRLRLGLLLCENAEETSIGYVEHLWHCHKRLVLVHMT